MVAKSSLAVPRPDRQPLSTLCPLFYASLTLEDIGTVPENSSYGTSRRLNPLGVHANWGHEAPTGGIWIVAACGPRASREHPFRPPGGAGGSWQRDRGGACVCDLAFTAPSSPPGLIVGCKKALYSPRGLRAQAMERGKPERKKGGARRSQEEPGGAMRSQEDPRSPRRTQENARGGPSWIPLKADQV